MNKPRIPITFALATIAVFLSLYAEQKHKQSLTVADAAIGEHGESLVDR
jgi:hypothetical protein